MIPIDGDPEHWLFAISGGILAIAIALTAWRLFVGPSVADRVVALDTLGFLVVMLLCIFSVVTQRSELLGVALVAGLILFLGTAAFAVYLERRSQP